MWIGRLTKRIFGGRGEVNSQTIESELATVSLLQVWVTAPGSLINASTDDVISPGATHDIDLPCPGRPTGILSPILDRVLHLLPITFLQENEPQSVPKTYIILGPLQEAWKSPLLSQQSSANDPRSGITSAETLSSTSRWRGSAVEGNMSQAHQ